MKTVLISLLGTNLDRPRRDRWSHWRPTVAACMQPDLLIDRLELLYPTRYASMAGRLGRDVRKISPTTEVRLPAHDVDDPWDLETVYGGLHAFAAGYPFVEDERYLVHITTGTHVAQICLFLLAESRRIPGVLFQTQPGRGADHVVGSARMIDLDLSRYDGVAARHAVERATDVQTLKGGVETRNTAFNALIDQIEMVAARSRAPMLLMGPTGAGKTVLARRIYEVKRARRQVSAPLVEVNCATLRGDSALSALFGHRRGAFTGALEARASLLRAADGGVLFLDEIGALSLEVQAMLLRALESGAGTGHCASQMSAPVLEWRGRENPPPHRPLACPPPPQETSAEL